MSGDHNMFCSANEPPKDQRESNSSSAPRHGQRIPYYVIESIYRQHDEDPIAFARAIEDWIRSKKC